MAAKIKAVKKGTINTQAMFDKSLIGKRNIQDDFAEVLKELSDITIQPAPPMPNLEQLKENVYDPQYPYVDEGALTWLHDTHLPKSLRGLLLQVKGLFNIGKEIDSFTCRVWLPAEAKMVKSRTGKMRRSGQAINPYNVTTIPKAPMGIAARFIVCLGSDEVFKLNAAGKAADPCPLYIRKGQAFTISLGASNAFDVAFDDSSHGDLAERNGFRQEVIKKFPVGRIVVCFDGKMNTKALVEQIDKEAGMLKKDDPTKANEIANKLKSALGVSSEKMVDRIAAEMNKPDPLDEEIPDLIPCSSESSRT